MLCRLGELREAAGADVDVELEKPSSEEGTITKEQEQLDIDWLEFIEDMKEMYKEILEDEGACVQACDEVADKVSNMNEIVELERDALLPTKLAQLANRFESQELVCQRMIRRAKEMLTTLRADDQDIDEDDVALGALRPVRTSISKVRALEFKALVQGFFSARARNRQEMIMRAARQLRFAYPDALEEELKDIMEFPELAFVAISRRLEKGSEVTLDGILGEMEGKKADAKKLEQGAKELKLMFLQFAELIDTQGEALTAIEANIKTVIEETSEAIGVLLEAEEQKRAYERKKLKFYIIVFLLVFYFILYPWLFKRQRNPVTGQFEKSWFDVGEGDTLWAFLGMFHEGVYALAPNHYKQWYPKGTGGPAPAAPAPAAPVVVVARPQRRGWFSLAQLVQVVRVVPRRPDQHQLQTEETQQLTPEKQPVLESRKRLPGFIEPHKPLLHNKVMRSLALTARGGAAKHLRRPKAGMQSGNGTAP